MNKKILCKKILIIIFIITTISAQNIKFNEIYFSNINEKFPDFIEIINTSDDPISLLGYTLNINNNPDTLISNDNQYILEPQNYLVILNLTGAIALTEEKLKRQFPANTLFLTYMRNEFPFFRGVDNELNLFDEYGELADSIKLSIVTKPEFSKEYNFETNQWSESKVRFGSPGKLNSVLTESVDLSIQRMEMISTTDKLKPEINITINNFGHKNADDAKLRVYNDLNLNGVGEDDEIFNTHNINISSDDSLIQIIECKFDAPGIFSIIADINHAEDENIENNTQSLILKIPYDKSILLVNEFMYTPESSMPEWIELFNNSEKLINLKHWLIGDQSNKKFITSSNFTLEPKNYVVISEDSTFLDNWTEDVQFIYAAEGLPSFNNSGDSIKVIDPSGNVVDSLYYTDAWGDERGVSLEKIDPEGLSNDAGNWGLSVHEKGGTPGFVNSIIIKNFDLTFVADSTGLPERKLFPGDSINFYVTIKNIGKEASKPFTLNLYQSNNDSIFENIIATKEHEIIARNQTIIDTLTIHIKKSGIKYLKLNIAYEEDENQSNNDFFQILPVGFPSKSLVINEIMYNPDTGAPEWFEVANRSDSTVNIQNWLFRDSQNTIHKITEQSVSIPVDSFAVVTNAEKFLTHYENFRGILLQSTSFPTLNNSGDSLILLDPVENYIDSLAYSSEWGNQKAVSLERKSIEEKSSTFINWSLSTNESGSTPGFTNSIALKDFDLAIDTLYLKDKNILHNETAKLVVRISNNGAETIRNFDLSVNVYETLDKKVVISEKYITVNKVISAGYFTRYEIELPNIPGGVHPVIAKIYALKDYLQENNEFTTNINIGYPGNSVVVNEVMFAPESGEAEWVELFNTTNIKIDLNSWQFTDFAGKAHDFCHETFYLEPEDFVIIASNEEFRESYPNYNGKLFLPENFPTLNNTSDAVIFRDAAMHCVDSVYYMKSWGGNSGISVERRNPYVPAISRENWGSCEDTLGGTPGEINSILKYDYDLAIPPDGFKFKTPITKQHQENEFTITIINNGIYDSGNLTVKVFNDKNFDTYPEEEELVWSLHNIPSLVVDSSTTVNGKLFSENSGRTTYIAKVITNEEEHPENNSAITYLKIEFDHEALVLNEFLFAPEEGQTEFVECINNTDYDIILQGWELSNEWHKATIDFPTKIPSGQYVIFAADSNIFEYYPPISCPVFVLADWPGLNNTQDDIVLKDLTGKLIDSLEYKRSWGGGYGKSLEKIMPSYASQDSASWKLSEAELGATPGKFNSISPYVYDLRITNMTISETMGNTETLFDIKFQLENIGREICQDAQLQIYDMKFNSKSLYRTLKIRDIDSRSSDSLSMQLANLDKGYHKFLAQISWKKDQNSENDTTTFEINISFEPKDMLISEFMVFPKSVKTRGASISEYVEIYNPMNRSVYINEWKISDNNTADTYQIFSDRTIPAESYFVIASDSTIFNFPDVTQNNTVVLDKRPSFNNDLDMVVISDATGHCN
jgi:hypothetical protein